MSKRHAPRGNGIPGGAGGTRTGPGVGTLLTVPVRPEDAAEITRVWTRHREVEGNLGALTANYEAQKAEALAALVENRKRFGLLVEQMQERYALAKDTRWTYDLDARCFRRVAGATAPAPPDAPLAPIP